MGACQSWNAKASSNLDLEAGLNRIFFKEDAPLTAALLVELGEVLELAPSSIRNATIFNRLLFWCMQHEPTVTRSIPDQQLALCESSLGGIRSRVVSTSPAVDGELVKSELLNAIDMATHGIHRLQYARGAPLSRDTLRENLSKIIGNHENLWLARNRPGGLRESAGHLYQSLSCI